MSAITPPITGRQRRPRVPVVVVVAAELGWGLALLAGPTVLLGRGPHAAGRPTALAAGGRVLGVRHVTQAVILARHPGTGARRLSACVDLAHAATMAVLGSVSPTYRLAAGRSLTVSMLFALATAS